MTTVIGDLRFVGSSQVFAGNVFFTEAGEIKKVPVAGGAATLVAGYPFTTETIAAIAVDATGLYWVTTKDPRRLTF